MEGGGWCGLGVDRTWTTMRCWESGVSLKHSTGDVLWLVVRIRESSLVLVLITVMEDPEARNTSLVD